MIVASDLNCCHFIGRLGADPETRYLPSGDPVASIRLAVGWKTKEREGTEWLSLVAFGKTAEVVASYCKKGSQIFAACRVKVEEYEKNGEKRYATKFVIDRLQLLGRAGEGSGSGGGDPAPRPAPKPAAGGGGVFEGIEDDIPF